VKISFSVLKEYDPVVRIPSNLFGEPGEVPFGFGQFPLSHGHIVVAIIKSNVLVFAVRNQASAAIDRM
jgi:hypothetical protein